MGLLPLNGKNKKFKQGFYYPKNKEKFIGNEKAVYRSGLELSYFRLLDNNDSVLKWGSEEVVIPYFFDKKLHNYFVDLFVIFKLKNGQTKKCIIELKPYCQVEQPKWSPRRKKENYINECYTWQKNKAKWIAASKYAKERGWEFHVLTEKDIKKD